ncbi:MAG: hypothetical protein LBB05_01935 [Puniceicoccales bacterium]|jgi:hypothetical protein|nr:hypothetical protein [Puniceicoccales bacterium]
MEKRVYISYQINERESKGLGAILRDYGYDVSDHKRHRKAENLYKAFIAVPSEDN